MTIGYFVRPVVMVIPAVHLASRKFDILHGVLILSMPGRVSADLDDVGDYNEVYNA